MEPLLEAVVLFKDLEDVRDVLKACLNHLQASDLANAYVNLDDVRYRPLTSEVAVSLQHVESLISDHIVRSYNEEAEEEFEEEDDEFEDEVEEELADNPLQQIIPGHAPVEFEFEDEEGPQAE